MQKLKNNETRPKFTGSYIKKKCVKDKVGKACDQIIVGLRFSIPRFFYSQIFILRFFYFQIFHSQIFSFSDFHSQILLFSGFHSQFFLISDF